MLAIGAGTGALAQSPAPFTLDDALRIAELSEPVFTPDGASVLYTLTTNNLEEDAQVSDIWRVPYAGGEAVSLTGTPETSEWSVEPSADGSFIAYLSDAPAPGQDEDDAETQVWIAPTAGGAPRIVTRIPGGVSDYALAPDGERLVAVAEVGSRVGLDDEKTAPPIVIDRFQYKEDGRGYLDDRRQHLFLVDVASGVATQLTTGRFDHWAPAWSPDGSLIAFVSKRTGDPDRNLDFDVFVMPPEPGAEPRRMGDYPGADNDPSYASGLAWSPDSKRVAWLRGGADEDIWYAPNDVAVGEVATGQASADFAFDRFLYHPKWSAAGETDECGRAALHALLEDDRETYLVRLVCAFAPIYERVTSERSRFAADFAVGPHGEIVVLDGSDDRPYELRALPRPGEGGEPRTLTHHNDWLAERRLGDTREVSARSGRTEIHGLLVTPPGYDGSHPLPLIVRVHGGPVYQYSHEFMPDWQVYAAQGYAVLGVNPRGSSGRGFDFARAIYADWGGPDVEDVLAMIDEVVAMGIADPERVGVGGWSYGGILTDYLIASDPRFKAAVSGAGMANFLGGYGADQYAREYEIELGAPWDDARLWRRLSYPFLKADRIETPTLFLCAEEDVNVPCIGSEQMYQALRSRDVPTRLIVYPGETHGLTVPSYIRDRLERSLAWYDRYLSTERQAER